MERLRNTCDIPPVTKMLNTGSLTKTMPTGTERILLVDDDAIFVDLGWRMLRILGYTVTARTGSMEALEVFKARPLRYDLIITDMMMPVMSGIGLARKLRKIRPELPIIICSGMEMDPMMSTTERINGYLLKPFDMKLLAGVVRNVLDRRK